MTTHAFYEYMKYRWRAKGRHGVHSPFVYDLVAQVLLDKGPIERRYIIEYPSLALKYENLLSRIAGYYHYTAIQYLSLENEGLINERVDMGLMRETEPKQWACLLNKHFKLLKNESIVSVAGIHKSIEHSVAWKKLCADEQVRMSIDVYGLGLLLFRDEFRERQHFILKY